MRTVCLDRDAAHENFVPVVQAGREPYSGPSRGLFQRHYGLTGYKWQSPWLVLAVGLSLLGADAAPVAAHHAFAAEFDANRPVLLTGVVTKMDWVNPHSWIHIDVKKPDGTVEKWMIEGGTPNTLLRRGLRKNDLPPGTVIKVEGFQAKDGALRANGRNLTLPDGRGVFLGSATGAAAP